MAQPCEPPRLTVVASTRQPQQSPVPVDVAQRWAALTNYMNQWFYRADTQALEISLTSCAAHFDASCDPLWFQIIGPSGGGKTTTIINPLSDLPTVRHMGDLTPKTFLSGYKTGPDKPPASLLHQIGSSGILLFKDFTTILSKRHEDRAEIASQFREIYDGAFSRDTGRSGVQRWFGKITILVAATPAIERYWALHRELGERFLQLRWSRQDGRPMARAAARQIGHEKVIGDTLKRLTKEFFTASPIAIPPPEISEEQRQQIAAMAEVVSYLRGHVNRDTYTRQINDFPQIEDSTRLGKTLVAICRYHAALFRKQEVDDDDLAAARRVALDTVPSNRAKIVTNIPTQAVINSAALAQLTLMTAPVMEYATSDLESLGAVHIDRSDQFGNTYGFTDHMKVLWIEAFGHNRPI